MVRILILPLFSLLIAVLQSGCQNPMVCSISSLIPIGVGTGLVGLTAIGTAHKSNQLDSVSPAIGRSRTYPVGGSIRNKKEVPGTTKRSNGRTGGMDRTSIGESLIGVSVTEEARIYPRASRPSVSSEFGVVVESMVYDTRGEALVRVSRNGNVRVVGKSVENATGTGMLGSRRPVLDLPSGKLESIVVLLDDGRTRFVIQEVEGLRFGPGDRVRVTNDRYMHVYHL